MMIGNKNGFMWVIADLVSRTFGVKFKTGKSGRRMSSHGELESTTTARKKEYTDDHLLKNKKGNG